MPSKCKVKPMRGVWVFLLLIVFSVVAFGQGQTIQPGDKLMIQVAEEASLNKEYVVTADGLVLMNFLGAVKVSGLTESEAATQIRTQLVDQRILRQATVSLRIVRNIPMEVTIGGSTTTPGVHPFVEGMTLADLFKLAPPTEDADLTKVSVTSGQDAPVTVDFTRYDAATGANNPVLKPGDTIQIPAKVVVRTFTVLVSGAVQKPGLVTLTEGETLGQAIEKAGGLMGNADPKLIKLHRANADAATVDLLRDDKLVLQPSDAIEVPIEVQKYMITVEGAVGRPGIVEVHEGMKLTEVLKLAGGMSPHANRDRVQIAAGPEDKKPKVINVEDILLGYTGDVLIKPGQRVIVPAGKKGISQNVKIAAGAAVLLFLFGR